MPGREFGARRASGAGLAAILCVVVAADGVAADGVAADGVAADGRTTERLDRPLRYAALALPAAPPSLG